MSYLNQGCGNPGYAGGGGYAPPQPIRMQQPGGYPQPGGGYPQPGGGGFQQPQVFGGGMGIIMPTQGGMLGYPAQLQAGAPICFGNTPEPTTDGSAVSPSLSPEQKARTQELLGYIANDDWKTALEKEFSKDYFQELIKFVEKERTKETVYPPADQVFSWTQYCTLDSVKVVILGQDPYPGPEQAHGLCFSVQNGVECPQSLENIYKELINDIDGFQHPGHGTLIGWAEQGVLLLNSCLTVGHNKSHKGQGWEKFTDAVISWLNENKTELVFILWGKDAKKKAAQNKDAQKKESCIIDKKKHCVLTGVHPSPKSAYKGFFGCKHFSKCNAYLEEKGKTPIDWNLLPPHD